MHAASLRNKATTVRNDRQTLNVNATKYSDEKTVDCYGNTLRSL